VPVVFCAEPDVFHPSLHPLYVNGPGVFFSRMGAYVLEPWPRAIRISELPREDGTIARIHRLKQKRRLP
jgi:hypothetical protein